MTFRSLLLVFLFSWSTTTFGQDTATADAAGTQYVEFKVQLDTDTTDSFVVEVHSDWAPIGAARFMELGNASFFPEVRFFRVVEEFVCQFGIHGDPAVAAEWRDQVLVDDPVLTQNTRGTISYATSGVNTRTTQMFINLVDNLRLDDMGFAPFARVVPEDMNVVDRIYSGYGEAPDQAQIQSTGNAYLNAEFPLLSYIISVDPVSSATTTNNDPVSSATTTNNEPETPPEDEPESSQNEEPFQPLSSSGATKVGGYSAGLVFIMIAMVF